MKNVLKHNIEAQFTEDSITVYQAYNTAIGHAAVAANTLDVPAFSKTRMTWIKPSYLWMMYRCGWGQKDANQTVILRIEMTRTGFCDILNQACLASYDADAYGDRDIWAAAKSSHPNRVQWDPDKDMWLKPLPKRAIQIGIAPPCVQGYLDAILSVDDITTDAQSVRDLIAEGNLDAATAAIPKMSVLPEAWLKTARL